MRSTLRSALSPAGVGRGVPPEEEPIPATDEDRVLEVLDDDECHELLAASSIGRLGYTDGALPAILPVSFALHAGSVLVATRVGSPVSSAVRGAVVAFQVDAWSGVERTGWSVTAVGPARVIAAPAEVARFDGLHVPTGPPAADRCFIAVRTELFRGWRMSARPGV